MKVIKRDGHMVDYSPEKIENAIMKANKDVPDADKVSSVQIRNIIKYIEGLGKKRILVEDIQDIIEMKLMSIGKFALAKKYITYRYTRELVRKSNTTDVAIKNLISDDCEYWSSKNISKNIQNAALQRDYLAGITSTDITRRFLLPEDIVKAHDDGILYFHNMEYFAQNAIYNSSVINLEDMLQNGCNINGIHIDRPENFTEAINITLQIIASVLPSQYGSLTINVSHLAPFVVESYKKNLKKYQKIDISKSLTSKYATDDLKDEVSRGIKNLLYGINTLNVGIDKQQDINIYMYLKESKQYKQEQALLIEEVFKQTIAGFKELISPNLTYILEEDNINKDSQYYYLTSLALECATKRMNIAFISEKVFIELYNTDSCFPLVDKGMFIPMYSKENIPKYYGRFNQGIITLNLVDIALTSDKDMNLFWDLLEERLELCHRALQIRHKRLSKVNSNTSPILWQHGAISRLDADVNIHELLHHDYSTLSLGFAGLHECVNFMKGTPFYEDIESQNFAIKILEKLNSRCKMWRDVEKIAYTVCGIQNEQVCQTFAFCLKERFGEIKGITDKDYITCSCSIPCDSQIDLYTKISIESNMQKNIMGNSIIDIEIGNINKTNKELEDLLQYIYENVLYIQINGKKDICLECGYEGIIRITNELKWQCPKCKNEDESKLIIIRKLYGNTIKNDWSIERKKEIKKQKIYFDEETKEVTYEY